MNWIFTLFVSTILIFSTVGVYGKDGDAPSTLKSVDFEWVKVKGMVCEVCAYGIRKKLKKEPEVKDVEVRIKEHKVKVVYKDPKQTLSREKLRQILEDAGYALDSEKN